MDEFSSVQANPQVQFNQSPFFSSFFGNTLKVLIPVILIIGSAFLVTSYIKMPKKTTVKASVSFVAPRQGTVPDKLSLPCPVPGGFCNLGKLTTYQKSPALIYNLPAGTDILAINSIQSSADMAVLENHNTNVKIFYLAAQDKEGCYTVTYTIPGSSDFITPTSYPVKIQTSISKASSETISTDNGLGNLIVMIRKNPIPDTNLCIMQDNPFREYGPFQPLDKYISGLK